jgi:hypothetical protein
MATTGGSSPFAEYTQDSTPVQRKVVHDYIERVREAMDRAMTDLELPQPAPVCGAMWAVSGRVTFTHIALADMEPQRMRGYRARLRQWLSHTLAGMRATFHAQAGPLRAQMESRASVASGESSRASLEAELRRLEEWPA